MNFAGEVHRAFPVNRIPPGGIGCAEVLNLEPDSDDGFLRRQADDTPDSVPCGSAGGSPQDINTLYFSSRQPNRKLRRAELFSIPPQGHLPGEAASGRRCGNAFQKQFLS